MLTHDTVEVSTPNELPMSGRATLTMLPSTPSMKVAKKTTASSMAVCFLSRSSLILFP